MQSVSAQLTAACQADGQRPVFYVEFSWNRTGSIAAARGGSGWVDESAYLESHNGQLAINPPGERLVAAGQVGSATVTMINETGRFSWLNASGALYAHIGSANSPAGPVGTACRIWQGYVTSSGPEYVCIFTGVVAGWAERPDATVVFSLRDWGYTYQQNRISLPVSEDVLPDEWIETAALAGGIAAGLMVLDRGILPILYAWMDEETVVEEIWLAAEADGGLALFDQRGRLLYWNALHWVGLATVWTFRESDYELSEPETDASAVATEVTVEWSPRAPAPETDLYVLDKPRTIMPGKSDTWEARLDYAALEINDPDPATPFNDYYAVSPGGLAMNSAVTITLSDQTGQKCNITATNTSTAQAARLEYLRLRGRPLVGGPTEQAKATASPQPLPFARTRALRSNTSAGQGMWQRSAQGNVYLQSAAQGQALADMLALRCRRVRPVWTLRGAPGVPQLELGDRIAFVDSRKTGNGAALNGLVIGLSWEAGAAAGYVQTLRVMDLTDMAEYDNYFVIGASTLGANRRCWY
ncbi:MAG TPA: hypothetical protein PKL67_08380 [Anaerolineae bacterium]|nr:hypothetical protein [Anaerolineae bacterium]